MFLDGIHRRREIADAGQFPWTLPLFRDLEALDFRAPVTFLVGENGSGKSTLLEALAVGMSAAAAGRHDLSRDGSLDAARRMAAGLVMRRSRHARNRHFIRAEDVFGFVLRIKAEIDNPTDPFSRGQFMARYGENPDARSHGETFLHLLEGWVATTGLYFLDEPETPLSPTRVLALMALIKQRVSEGSQFIIATHSPILMAQPDSEILLLEDGRIRSVAYDELEHVKLTRQFLADPERFLRHL